MQIIVDITIGLFTYFLVRRPAANSTVEAPVWRWAIIAKSVKTGETFVYRPEHWRDTAGEESPFRPFNEFFFMTENVIHPVKSGWRRAS